VTVEKVSLSLEAGVVAEARAASGGNLSAYVNEAVEARLRNRRLREVLDEFEHEFPPDPDEESRVRNEFRAGMAKIDAANRELDEILVHGTELLDEHPLVDEAVITMGSLQSPVAYVVLTDERGSIAETSTTIRAVLERVASTWHVDVVIVPRPPRSDGDGRPVLPGIVPL
jgi:hypothetical protein